MGLVIRSLVDCMVPVRRVHWMWTKGGQAKTAPSVVGDVLVLIDGCEEGE